MAPEKRQCLFRVWGVVLTFRLLGISAIEPFFFWFSVPTNVSSHFFCQHSKGVLLLQPKFRMRNSF